MHMEEMVRPFFKCVDRAIQDSCQVQLHSSEASSSRILIHLYSETDA